jgi:hypothetical protein
MAHAIENLRKRGYHMCTQPTPFPETSCHTNITIQLRQSLANIVYVFPVWIQSNFIYTTVVILSMTVIYS